MAAAESARVNYLLLHLCQDPLLIRQPGNLPMLTYIDLLRYFLTDVTLLIKTSIVFNLFLQPVPQGTPFPVIVPHIWPLFIATHDEK